MKIILNNKVEMFVSSDIPENKKSGSKVFLENTGDLSFGLKEPLTDLKIPSFDVTAKDLKNGSYGISISGRKTPASHGDRTDCLPIISGFKLDSGFTSGELLGSIYSTTSNKRLIKKIISKEKLALYKVGIINIGGSN